MTKTLVKPHPPLTSKIRNLPNLKYNRKHIFIFVIICFHKTIKKAQNDQNHHKTEH